MEFARRTPRWAAAIVLVLVIGPLFTWLSDALVLPYLASSMSGDDRAAAAIGIGVAAATIAATWVQPWSSGDTPGNRGKRLFLTGQMPEVDRSFLPRREQEALSEAFKQTEPAVDTVVLVGMGGVGKTQLAVQYAMTQKKQRKIDVLVWVNASSRSSIIETYASAARQVGVVPRGEESNSENAAQLFRKWLDERKRKKSLVVLDDVADPKDLINLLPRSGERGNIVITARQELRAYDPENCIKIDVDPFAPEQAGEYLQERLRKSSNANALAEVDELSKDLGCLPLALDIAAAYILSTKITCADYRVLLDARRSLVDPEGLGGHLANDKTKHERMISDTWSISIKRLQQQLEQQPEQRDASLIPRRLMELLSLLDPNGVPFRIIDASAVHDYLGCQSSVQIRWALTVLRDFRLLTDPGDDKNRPIRLHALVQLAVRKTSAANRIKDATRTLAYSMSTQWPGVPHDKYFARLPQNNSVTVSNASAGMHNGEFSRLLQDNAIALSRASLEPLMVPRLDELLFRLGDSYGQAGRVEKAHEYFEDLLRQVAEVLDADPDDTLRVRANEAIWLGYDNKVETALTKFQALERDMSPGKSGDLRLFFVRHNVGRFTGRSKDDKEIAVDYLRRLVEDETGALGACHEQTLDSRGILGYWMNKAGHHEAAAAELNFVIDLLIAHDFGPKHSLTLRVRNDLADVEASRGNYDIAIAVGQEVSRARMETVGPKDPATLTSRANLARWKGQRGQAADRQAAAELADVVSDADRYLGKKHGSTLRYRTYHIEAIYEQAKADGQDTGPAIDMMTSHCNFMCQEAPENKLRIDECLKLLNKWRGTT
jgi:tetratricopeptide (TPR) repeat protein